MFVTSVTPYDRKRSKVCLDGSVTFLLYHGEIRDFGIREGEDLSEETCRTILEDLLPKRCTKRAMALMMKQDYTEKKLRDKLEDGEYPPEAVQFAIDYVKSYHYLDDERYARDYITYQMALRSRGRIEQDLRMKGISQDVYGPILEECYEEADPDTELKKALELLRKKHYEAASADLKEKQKMMAFLYRKGYASDVVKRVRLFHE